MESLTTLMANKTAITQVPNALIRLKSIVYVSLCGFEGLFRDVFPSIIWLPWYIIHYRRAPKYSEYQKLAASTSDVGECLLPGDNNTDWLSFNGEGGCCFGDGVIAKNTAVYLIHDESIDQNIDECQEDVIVNSMVVGKKEDASNVDDMRDKNFSVPAVDATPAINNKIPVSSTDKKFKLLDKLNCFNCNRAKL
ncbi:hypothetical protein HN51_048180 [Arachis hypogaea]